jgi:hypothetical protein
MTMNDFLRTGMHEDAKASLTRWAEEAGRVSTDPTALKWMVLAAHSALQGFMALVLYQGNGFLVMRPEDAKAWMQAHDANGPYPETKMDSFLGLYKKVNRADSFLGLAGSKPFMPDAHDVAMRRLNSVRNDFVHFTASGWSIERAYVLAFCAETADVVDFCTSSVAFPWSHFGDVERTRSEALHALAEIRRHGA